MGAAAKGATVSVFQIAEPKKIVFGARQNGRQQN
jgi:hypothetical protein